MPASALFSGFASEAVAVIAGMLALGEALVVTGVTQRLVGYGTRLGGSERRLCLLVMLLAAVPSGFISDVGLVGVLMPVASAPSGHPPRPAAPAPGGGGDARRPPHHGG